MRSRKAHIAGATLLLSGLLAAGCGGSGHTNVPLATVKQVPTTEPAVPTAPNANSGANPAAAKSHKPKTSKAIPHGKTSSATLQNALNRLPANRRHIAALGVAETALKILGFDGAKITATPSGDAVAASVPAANACGGSPSTESQLKSQIRRGAPFVHSVQITVEGSGQSLSQYLSSNCHDQGLPGGPGRVVLTQRGSGSGDTKSFTVRSSRWTVEYANGGSFLQALLMKGQFPTGNALSATKRGPGRKVMTRRGTFRLKVIGTGDWVVRVRDGA